MEEESPTAIVCSFGLCGERCDKARVAGVWSRDEGRSRIGVESRDSTVSVVPFVLIELSFMVWCGFEELFFFFLF